MSNHRNYDVVRLLRLGWNYLAEPERQAARGEFKKMLDWCLHASLQSDGSFRYNHSDDSLGDSFYFGTSLLAELGYFDKSRRFWTSDDFPEAEGVRQKILANLRKIGNQDPMARNAAAKLEGRD